MAEIIIRQADVDLEILRQFEQGIIAAERPFTPVLKKDPIRYYDIEAMIGDPAVDLLIAEWKGEPVACGYARVEDAKPYYRTAKEAYLGMMYVVPQHRGKGLIGLILQSLKQKLGEKGISELRLDVFSANTTAISAYLKAGFRPHLLEMRTQISGSGIY